MSEIMHMKRQILRGLDRQSRWNKLWFTHTRRSETKLSSKYPVHPDTRNSGYEYGIPITIGDNVWLGGNTIVLPGVTIGDNVVIGAGSVVTKDIPSNVIAVGGPCRVIREITDADRDYYFKDRRFDVTDY